VVIPREVRNYTNYNSRTSEGIMGAYTVKDGGGATINFGADGAGSAVDGFRGYFVQYDSNGVAVGTFPAGEIETVLVGGKLRQVVEANTTASVPPSLIVDETNYKSVYLTDGGGSEVMAINGATTPTIFDYKPAAGKKIIVGRMLFYFSDSTAFTEDKFAGITALSNGVSVLVNGVEIKNWKNNIDVVTTCFDAEGRAAFTAINRSLACRWTFSKAAGNVEGLTVLETNGIGLSITDNLSGLDFFQAQIQGVEIDV